MSLARRLLGAEALAPTSQDQLSAVHHNLIKHIAQLVLWSIVLIIVWTSLCVVIYDCFKDLKNRPGLKKKALQLLPTAVYPSRAAENSEHADCAICLSEFSTGDVTKALPQCGHMFHVNCIDAWLHSRSSCPSCRRLVVVHPSSVVRGPDQA